MGDLIADHFVELQANAHVSGNICYQQLTMDVGASVDGKLTKREAAQSVKAPPLLVTLDESTREEREQRNEHHEHYGRKEGKAG